MADRIELDRVRKAMVLNRQILLEKYGAIGIGIGKSDSKNVNYNIVVFVESRDKIPQKNISIEGIPVKFKVTGKIKKL